MADALLRSAKPDTMADAVPFAFSVWASCAGNEASGFSVVLVTALPETKPAGIVRELSPVQLLNIFCMLVTFAVLKLLRSRLVRADAQLNMQNILVTLAVLKLLSLTDVRFEHPANMQEQSVRAEVRLSPCR